MLTINFFCCQGLFFACSGDRWFPPLFRMAMCLMRTSQIYLPPDLRSTDVKVERRGDYYLSMGASWGTLFAKHTNQNINST